MPGIRCASGGGESSSWTCQVLQILTGQSYDMKHVDSGVACSVVIALTPLMAANGVFWMLGGTWLGVQHLRYRALGHVRRLSCAVWPDQTCHPRLPSW